jgi:hypothetical protein
MMSSPFLSLFFTDVTMKTVIILFCFLPVLFLLLVDPSHAAVSHPSSSAVATTIYSLPHKTLLFHPVHPTAVTLARVQVAPAYPLFGIVGSLALIALILMYRVYRSI